QRWASQHPPLPPTHPFTHKTILVTGANTGVGFHAALKFAALDAAHLILAVRTPAKGAVAKARILESRPSVRITVLRLDLESFASVREFLRALDETLQKEDNGVLDVALLNAGIAAPRYSVNKQTGWESALQVNVLSTAMLAVGLMPILRRRVSVVGEPAQMTFTGSVGHVFVQPGQIPVSSPGERGLLGVVSSKEFFDIEGSYCVIKLLGMYVMRGLVDEYASASGGEVQVFVNAACPGFCVTDLGREFPWYMVWITKVLHWYSARTAEEGSRSLVSAALLGAEGHGRFWVNDGFPGPAEMLTSPEGRELQAKLWGEIRAICVRELARRG
ncbi:NAD(P)-binding protein, partial [Aspergillus ellipticus CBS 707.79]